MLRGWLDLVYFELHGPISCMAISCMFHTLNPLYILELHGPISRMTISCIFHTLNPLHALELHVQIK